MDRAALVTALRATKRVNDPFLGDTTPVRFEAESRLWPEGWRHVLPFATTKADGRRVVEMRYSDDGATWLPVGFVFDGPQVYVYSDHHLVEDRGPILEPVEGLHPSRGPDDVLAAYFEALNGNRLEAVLDLFEPDGYFRHSNDETFRGREELRKDFSKMMGASGIRIKYCRVTDDGRTCVVEAYMPSGRPAIAVYERGGPGKLKAVRIYL